MELRPIPAADWADWYENELCTTFPDCECKPLADILSLAEAGRYEVLGLYDGPDLLGYAALWSAPDWPGCVLLDYLGVTAARRNGGLGGWLLALLSARLAGQAVLIIEAEAEDSGGPEEERPIRLRRLDLPRLHPGVRELQLRPGVPGLCAGPRPGGSGAGKGRPPGHLWPGPTRHRHRPRPRPGAGGPLLDEMRLDL